RIARQRGRRRVRRSRARRPSGRSGPASRPRRGARHLSGLPGSARRAPGFHAAGAAERDRAVAALGLRRAGLPLADRRGLPERQGGARGAVSRLCVYLVVMFFSMLFWACFEQAGSSVNNFTDRNVDRVIDSRPVTTDDVGKAIEMRIRVQTSEADLAELPVLNQEQLGRHNGDGSAPFTLTELDGLRAK